MPSCSLHSGLQIRPSYRRHRATTVAAVRVGPNRFSRYHDKKKAVEKPINKKKKSVDKSDDDSSKLAKGGVLVTENEDGTVLFAFEPEVEQALADNQAVVGKARQKVVSRKLQRGQALDFQLWETKAQSEAAASASTADALSNAAETETADRQENGASSNGKTTTVSPHEASLNEQQSDVSQNGSSLEQVSQNGSGLTDASQNGSSPTDVSQDGLSPADLSQDGSSPADVSQKGSSSIDGTQKATSVPETPDDGSKPSPPSYSTADTAAAAPSAAAAASISHEQSNLDGDGATSLPTKDPLPRKKPKSKSKPSSPQASAEGVPQPKSEAKSRNETLVEWAQRLAKNPDSEQTAQGPFKQSSAKEKAERSRTPCYLWHESGQPTRADFKGFLHGTSDGDPSDSESPSSSADASAVPSQEAHMVLSTLQRLLSPAWQPLWQSVVKLWRLLPYWLRKRLGGGQQQVPEVHASPIIAQHMMASDPTQPVPGSTFDAETGRSPTPLIDLSRHQIEALVGTDVKNVNLFRTALTHKSAVPGDSVISASNDRLEFLGDAVVGLVFTSWVYNRFPKDDDGAVSYTTHGLLSNRSNLLYATQINLSSYVAMNIRHMWQLPRVHDDVLADTFEALVGALYLDSGMQAASDFVLRVAEEAMSLSDLTSYRNYKSYLHNNLKQQRAGVVKYDTYNYQKGLWVCKCRLHGKLVGIGLDSLQPKKAEAAAAFAAMNMLGFGTQPSDFRKVYGADAFAFGS